MAYIVMANIVMAYIVMANIVMAYIVMANIVMASVSCLESKAPCMAGRIKLHVACICTSHAWCRHAACMVQVCGMHAACMVHVLRSVLHPTGHSASV